MVVPFQQLIIKTHGIPLIGQLPYDEELEGGVLTADATPTPACERYLATVGEIVSRLRQEL